MLVSLFRTAVDAPAIVEALVGLFFTVLTAITAEFLLLPLLPLLSLLPLLLTLLLILHLLLSMLDGVTVLVLLWVASSSAFDSAKRTMLLHVSFANVSFSCHFRLC